MLLSLPLREAVSNANRPLIGAHRGAGKQYPENTLPSFCAAAQFGADFIELDVQLSQDGIPVVIHDGSIDRTTLGTGLVQELTSEQLNYWSIPSLAEVFAVLGRKVYFNIELKPSHNDNEMIDAVLDLLYAYSLQDNSIISSFNHNALRKTRLLDKRILIGVLFEEPMTDAVSYAKSMDADALHPYYRFVNRKLVKACHQENLMIFPWTVDKNSYLRYFTAINASGIITNRTEHAVKMLKTDFTI